MEKIKVFRVHFFAIGLAIALLLTLVVLPLTSYAQTATYVGSEACKTCHSGAIGNSYNTWKQTLHSKIHELPSAQTITGDFTTSTTINMGSSYGNATVTVRTAGGKYYAKVGASGTEYEIAYTYGGGWKQRYLTKIDSSYYIPPIQWNSNKYLDNSSGAWASYSPATWFNADGSLKTTNTNSFRAKSWDKNCMGCHVNGYKIDRAVAGVDTFWVGTWGANKSANDINVGCESCHGPASLHSTTGDKTKIVNPAKMTNNLRKLEVCGQCHNRASSWNGAGVAGTHEYSKDEINNKYFVPGDVLSNFMRFDGTPNQAGGPGLWPDGVTSKQHHQQYQDWQLSKHFSNPNEAMNCFTCHDSHNNTANGHQVRDSLVVGISKFRTINDDNTLCLACHATSGPFAGITKAMVQNPVANTATIAAVVSSHTKHSYDPTNTGTTGGASRCTKCHMTKTATTAKAYDIHSHSFKTVSPSKTLQYQAQGGMPNTCAASCHRNGTGKVPNFGITDASLSTWNEATDASLATELKFWDENMFYKERGGKGAAVSGLQTTTAPVIDADTSDWSDAAWAGVALANGKFASFKSKISGTFFYGLFRWADPTFSMVRSESWVRTGTTWTKNPGQSEDRIALMCNIDIPQSKWEQNGCMTKCHFDVNNPVAPDGDPEDDSYLMQGEHADLWHMKPARGLGVTSVQQSGTVVIDQVTHQATSGAFKLVGYIDDQNMKEYVGKPDGGRVGDAGSGMDTRNRNAAQTGPLYIEKNPNDYLDAMVLTKAEIDAGEAVYADSISASDLNTYWGRYQALGAVVPERYVKPPVGSRGDIQAAGLWVNGVWYLEVKRALNTGNTDDAQLTAGQTAYFGIALMDNGGGEIHWTQGNVLNKFGVGIPVGVEQIAQLVPEQFVLNQNYPNPFNPSTEIRFAIPKQSNVKLVVYDIIGRVIATLVNETLPVGNYRTMWNGKADDGRAVSSSVYFYHIQADGFTATKKMVLIK